MQLGDKRVGATLAQRFVHGSFWSLVGAAGAQGLTLGASMFTARLLGKESFGQFSFLQGTVSTAATFVGFGLGLTGTRYVASFRQEDPQRAGSLIKFVMTFASVSSAVASAIMVLAAPYLAVHVFHLPELTVSIRWAALYLFCVTVNGVQTGVLAGFESFRAVANVNITRGVGTLLLTVPLVMLWHIEGAFAAMGLAGCLAYGMSLFQIAEVTKAHGIPKTRTLDWDHAKVLWTFSLPTLLAGLLVTPVTWVVSLWLSRQPNGYGELGLFGAANQWRTVVSFFPLVLCQPLVPLLTSVAIKRNRSFNRLLASSIFLTTVVSAIVSAGVVCVMPEIAGFYGKGYANLTKVLVPLMLTGVLTSACTTIGLALASQERMWTGAILNLFWACALLTAAYYAIPLAGAQGLAYSFLAAQLLLLCISLYWGISSSSKVQSELEIAP